LVEWYAGSDRPDDKAFALVPEGEDKTVKVGTIIMKNNLTTFTVRKNGRLECRDLDGLIWTARPVR